MGNMVGAKTRSLKSVAGLVSVACLTWDWMGPRKFDYSSPPACWIFCLMKSQRHVCRIAGRWRKHLKWRVSTFQWSSNERFTSSHHMITTGFIDGRRIESESPMSLRLDWMACDFSLQIRTSPGVVLKGLQQDRSVLCFLLSS